MVRFQIMPRTGASRDDHESSDEGRPGDLRAARLEFEQNHDRFITVSREKAERGDPASIGLLPGLLSKSDPDEASHWDEIAGTRGRAFWRSNRKFPLRMIVIRMVCQENFFVAAELHYPFAMERSGDLAFASGNKAEALRWYELAAEAGRSSAMFDLYELLWPLDPVQVRDPMIAISWLRRSAESGFTLGMLAYARFLARVSWAESQSWIEKAKDAGEPLAESVGADLLRDYEATQN